jgi:HTH-type transcriptional regulator/antitoxin HigA
MEPSAVDPEKYGELLARYRPGVIEDLEEHERLLTIAEQLMDKGENLPPEERKLLELLVLLIEVFEHQIEDTEDGDDGDEEPYSLPLPHETLQRLMQSRDWDPDVLNDIFGNPANVRDVLSGRRGISKGQARALGKLFGVPHKLFFSE